MKTETPARHPPDPTDEQLIRRMRGGDDRAFETLVYRYERPLYGYLLRYLGDADLAADTFQATFLRVHEKKETFVEGKRFRPWLYAIATRQAIDILRREKRHRRMVHDGAGREEGLLATVIGPDRRPDDQAADREDRRRMRAAVRRLSIVQRRAVHLVYDQGLAYREAAQVLGVPVGTVKSRLHSAILALGRLVTGSPPTRAYALAAKAQA